MFFDIKQFFENMKNSEELTYEDIPRHSKTELLNSSYPQQIVSTVPIRTLEYFVNRYADELRSYLDHLPLAKEDLNKLIMPVIYKLFSYGNLLPASENHHHSGLGGLVVHSLQCAAACVSLAENKTFYTATTQLIDHNNKMRWIVAAGIMGLLHDIGKLFDIRVFAANGSVWNPNSQSLLEWGKYQRCDQCFVAWNSKRINKQHELRSVRLGYFIFLNKDLVLYLSEYTNDDILGAIDDAIVRQTGPFADLLRQAEACSIQQDAVDRRHLGLQYLQVASPVFAILIMTIKQLLATGVWTVNQLDSHIFRTTKGVFLRFSDNMIRDLYQTVKEQGTVLIPSTRDGLIQVMSDADLLEPTSQSDLSTDKWIWAFRLSTLHNYKVENSVKLIDPSLIFTQEMTEIAPIPVELDTLTTILPKDCCFLAPMLTTDQSEKMKSDSERMVKTKMKQVDLMELSESEVTAERTVPFSAEEAQIFVDRLLVTIIHQAQLGKGFLLQPMKVVGVDGQAFSTIPLEAALKKCSFDKKTSELLFRLSSLADKVNIDFKNHFFVMRRQNQCLKKIKSAEAT